VGSKNESSLKKVVGTLSWVLGIVGFVFFLFGLMLFLSPARTLEQTVFFLGFVLFALGLIKLVDGALLAKGNDSLDFIIVVSIVEMFIGMILVLQPFSVTGGVLLTFGVLAIMLAFLALVSGISQVIIAMRKKKKAVPMLIGIFYILLGLLMLLNPLAATLAVVGVIGLFVMIYGMLLIAVAWYANSLPAN